MGFIRKTRAVRRQLNTRRSRSQPQHYPRIQWTAYPKIYGKPRYSGSGLQERTVPGTSDGLAGIWSPLPSCFRPATAQLPIYRPVTAQLPSYRLVTAQLSPGTFGARQRNCSCSRTRPAAICGQAHFIGLVKNLSSIDHLQLSNWRACHLCHLHLTRRRSRRPDRSRAQSSNES